MIFTNPWAWLGLAAIAAPIAIHFFTRSQPRPLLFPTLRFLHLATASAMRRRTLRDRALLAVRVAILAAIVAALAQPYFRTLGRTAAGASALSRAVVIDTSASMNRPTASGRSALDLAHEQAASLQPAATATTTIEAAHLGDGIAEATTWLNAHGGRGQLAVVSDFQRGSLTDADLSGVPASAGISLVKVDVPTRATVDGPSSVVGDRTWTPHLTLDGSRTTATWTPAANAATVAVPIAGGATDAASIAAATAAAKELGVPASAPSHPIVVVLPSAPDRASRLTGAVAPDQPWMFDALARISTDDTLQAAARATTRHDSGDTTASAATVARDSAGAPLVEALSRPSANDHELVVLVHSDDALLLGALTHAVAGAGQDPAAIRELEPLSIPPDVLKTWERPTPETGAPAPDDPRASDGRWFWLVALVLLCVETWMRRSEPSAPATEVAHARVA